MLLKIEEAVFFYKKGHDVIKNVSLDIPENKICTFMGHNGAGKTTLFMLISGHLKLKSGQIAFNSAFIDSRKQIAFVPENGGFFDSLSVSENLRFFYLISQLPESELIERSGLLMEVFGLSDYEKSAGKELSSGLRKRLAIACALVGKPRLLMLDEPTNGIDPETRGLLIKILRQLRNNGTHILINSHDIQFAAAVSDLAAIFDRGRLVCVSENINDETALAEMYFEHTGNSGDVPYEKL